METTAHHQETTPRLSVVIVTYQCRTIIGECLRTLALALAKNGSAEVIVVDSASSDGVVSFLEAQNPQVQTIPLKENRGFAFGVNAGVAKATGEYVLLLNPDALIGAGALSKLLQHLIEHPSAAAVGPRITDRSGRKQASDDLFPTVRGELVRCWERLARPLGVLRWRDTKRAAQEGPQWISGACMLLRRDAFARLGGFDEGFFLYFEETDWCLRAARKNHDIHYRDDVEVVHIGGCCAENSGEVLRDGQVAKHFIESRRRYFQKNHGVLSMAAVEFLHVSRRLWLGLRAAVQPAGGPR